MAVVHGKRKTSKNEKHGTVDNDPGNIQDTYDDYSTRLHPVYTAYICGYNFVTLLVWELGTTRSRTESVMCLICASLF